MGGADVVDLILGCVTVGRDEILQTSSGTGNVPASEELVHVEWSIEKLHAHSANIPPGDSAAKEPSLA